jgi:polar amino acid transport system substrate-binding protein
VAKVGHPPALLVRHRLVLLVAMLVVVAVTAGGCASTDKASGDFTPTHHGVLTVATAEVPLDGLWNGTAAHPTGGFEYELAKDLAKQFGLATVKVVVVPFDQIIDGHLGGADLALSDLTATPERGQVLDFTGPYLTATPAALVRTGQSVPDLHTAQGLTWAVGRRTTLADFLDDTVQPNTTTKVTGSQHETVAAIEDHQVDAGLLDLPVAAAIARDSHGRLSVAGQFNSNDDISAALPQGSDNLDATSSAIRALIADGTIADLAEQWLGLRLDGTSADHIPLIRTED